MLLPDFIGIKVKFLYSETQFPLGLKMQSIEDSGSKEHFTLTERICLGTHRESKHTESQLSAQTHSEHPVGQVFMCAS